MFNKVSSENIVLANLFFRTFAVSLTTIYISAVFLIEVGTENWPQLVQLVQIFSLAHILLAVYLSKKYFYLIHKVMTLIFAIFILLYLNSPHSTFLITAVAALVFSIDLIGDITSTNAVMKLFNIISYKKLSSKIVFQSTLASVMASVTVIAIQRWGNLFVFSATVLSLSTLHFFMFHILTTRALLKSNEEDHDLLQEKGHQKIKSTLRYALKNPLVLMSFFLMIWSQVARFFCDWLYMTSSSEIFTNQEELSTFLSLANLAVMAIIILLQQTFFNKIIRRFSPSVILGIIPFSFLLLSSVGIMSKSPLLGISLNFLFMITYKTLHMPTLKISMQSLNEQKKARVFLLLNFSISILLLFVSSLMDILKPYFSYELIYIALIFMGVLAFSIVVQFDSKYLKSLWINLKKMKSNIDYNQKVDLFKSNYQDESFHYFNPHHLFVANYNKNVDYHILNYFTALQLFEKDEHKQEFIALFYAEVRSEFEKLLLVVNTYLFAKNIKLFQEAIIAHKSLLKSTKIEEKEKALQIFALIDTPYFRKLLKENLNTTESLLKKYAHKTILLKDITDHARYQASQAHNLLTIFAELNWEYLNQELQEKLKLLLQKPYHRSLKELCIILSREEMITSKVELLESFDIHKMNFNLEQLIQKYLNSDLEKRFELQYMLSQITPEEKTRTIVNQLLKTHLKKNKINTTDRREVISLLYLIEWLNITNKEYSYVTQSIHDYESLSDDEKLFWKDFHLEFLKKTDYKEFSKTVYKIL